MTAKGATIDEDCFYRDRVSLGPVIWQSASAWNRGYLEGYRVGIVMWGGFGCAALVVVIVALIVIPLLLTTTNTA